MRDECEGGRSDSPGISVASGSIDPRGIYDSAVLEEDMRQAQFATLPELSRKSRNGSLRPSDNLHYRCYNWPFVSTLGKSQ